MAPPRLLLVAAATVTMAVSAHVASAQVTPAAVLAPGGWSVMVGGRAPCRRGGDVVELTAVVTQDGVAAIGHGTVTCAGTGASYGLSLDVQGDRALDSGSAFACVESVILRGRGTQSRVRRVRGAQECEYVSLVPLP